MKKINELKKCYVCLKKLGFAGVTYNPNTKYEKKICLPTTENNLCSKVLKELACWGKCDRRCCSTWHMSGFDLDKHIEEIKNGYYHSKYRDFAVDLLHKVGRI